MAFAVLSMLAAEPIVAQQSSLGVTSGQTAAPFRYQIGRRITYVCPAIRPTTDVTVWGTDVYTFDSAVCLAAIHAGKLRAEQAAPVTFTMGPGAAAFTGRERNGVTSAGYGPYDSSYTFDSSTEPARIDGMTTMRLPKGFTDSVSVMCPPLGAYPQPLWGTDIYTEDSSICAAAAHVGLISLDAGGGPITVRLGGEQPSFAGSVRNGVTSQRYSSWPISFTVTGVVTAVLLPVGPQTATALPSVPAVNPRSPAATTAAPTSAANPAAAANAARFAPPPPRTFNLDGFTAVGEHGAVASKTITLGGFTATGVSGVVTPRTIALPGWTASGPEVRVNPRTRAVGALPGASASTPAPRTIALPGFTATGVSSIVPPRTIDLAGFTATGGSRFVLPRTFNLPGWTATGPEQTP